MDFTGLIPSFGNLAFTLAAFVVALSIIVAVHEYGHYIVGRWTGIHAEVFSLGFGPVLAARTDRRGTRWQLAALPFGGYVKFKGDADAASTPDGAAVAAMSPAERRHTMLGAPLWARALTVAAGPFFNFGLTIFLFLCYYAVAGVATDATTVGLMKTLPGAPPGLQQGDRITAMAGVPTPDLATLVEVADRTPPAASITYTVERDGQTLSVAGPYLLPPLADQVQPRSAAWDVGLRSGDVVLSVDGAPVHGFTQLRNIVGASDGRPLLLRVARDGTEFDITLVPRRMDMPLPQGGFETRWLIGLTGGLLFEPQTRTPGVMELSSMAVEQTWRIITTSLSGLGHMVTGAISSCNLQGPVGIAETSGAAAAQGTGSFVLFIAMLSTAVGLLNLFPVPILDGGHLVFHAWEALTGTPPSDRALRVLMSMGLTLLLGMMSFALLNDLILC